MEASPKKENTHIKIENILLKIKSKYILQEIFDNILKYKLFIIIKCSKVIQKKVDIDIKDYKKCSELYSSIEIEVKPLFTNDIFLDKKKRVDKHVHFINIKKGEEKYYHIYFDDNMNQEIKRNYLRKDDKVRTIKIKVDYQIKSFNKLFYNCKYIEYIDFKKFYRIDIIDMSGMFYGCSFLKQINFNNFNTENVTDMSIMFAGCSALLELNLSKFNTKKVTSMYGMFSRCSSLTKLDINNLNANKVTKMCFMFFECYSLKTLYFDKFIPNEGTDVFYMFSGCYQLDGTFDFIFKGDIKKIAYYFKRIINN